MTSCEELPESLTEIVLSIDESGWSPELCAVIHCLVDLETRSVRSPQHLGLGFKRWDADAKQGLAYQCYMHCILGVDLATVADGEDGDGVAGTPSTKLANLRVLARKQGVGLGYLRIAVRNHIQDLRRRQDPLAHARFQRIREAVRQLADRGRVTFTPGGKPDKFSTVCFVEGSHVVDLPDLVQVVASVPSRAALVQRLGMLGEEPTREIWDLFVHLEAAGCHSFVLGDLLTALEGLTSGGRQVSLGVHEPAAPSTSSGMSSDAAGLFEQDLIQRIRQAVQGSKYPAKLRARVLAMFDVRIEELGQPDDARSDGSPGRIGAKCGLDRRRASEAWGILGEILSPIVGSRTADRFFHRPSGT